MKKLEAHEVPLSKVFSSDYEFAIPDYQRPYTWGTEQATQLLYDLFEAVDRNPDEPYFLGSVVLVKDANVPESEVIDGQQRLTTLTILLSVLRELSDDEKDRDNLDKLIWEPGAIVSTPSGWRSSSANLTASAPLCFFAASTPTNVVSASANCSANSTTASDWTPRHWT